MTTRRERARVDVKRARAVLKRRLIACRALIEDNEFREAVRVAFHPVIDAPISAIIAVEFLHEVEASYQSQIEPLDETIESWLEVRIGQTLAGLEQLLVDFADDLGVEAGQLSELKRGGRIADARSTRSCLFDAYRTLARAQRVIHREGSLSERYV